MDFTNMASGGLLNFDGILVQRITLKTIQVSFRISLLSPDHKNLMMTIKITKNSLFFLLINFVLYFVLVWLFDLTGQGEIPAAVSSCPLILPLDGCYLNLGSPACFNGTS